MATPAIEVRGIRELGSAFRKVDKELPKEIRTELLPVAAMVIGAIRPKVEHVTGGAQSSLRPRATQKSAGIAFGGAAAPYFPWLDFGGSTGRGHRPGVGWSGAIRRDFIKGGRYVYPTIEEKRPEILDAVEEAIVAVARRAQLAAR